MHHLPIGTKKLRARGVAIVMATVGALALLIAGLPSMASATTAQTWVVTPNQSIQAAVDRAQSGDTIMLQAGTWTEGVCIWNKALKIIGAGADRTTITWPAWSSPSQLPSVTAGSPGARCWQRYAQVDAENDPSKLNQDVSGLFFYYPGGPISVSGLTTKNHPSNGISVWGGNGVTITHTKGVAHERYGIVLADSTNSHVTNNVEQGLNRGAPVYSGTAGISIADSTNAAASVTSNQVQGFNLGVFVREARSGSLVGNTVSNNCLGFLVFDDSATEIPDSSRHILGGNWKLVENTSRSNTRFCIAGRDGSQRTSGVGIAAVNTDHVSISGNLITGNYPNVPPGDHLTFPVGGVVLVSFLPPPNGPSNNVDPGLVEYTNVVSNTFQNNALDIWLTRVDPNLNPYLRAPGNGNNFLGNHCTRSDPAGLC
jgi:hypothetical protein